MAKHSFDAVIFDLDGVITQTALVHNRAWKKMFDDYLLSMNQPSDNRFREFTSQDYLDFVDGRPRYEGVRSFLDSRNIELPYGDPSDLPSEVTICGLGNRKNDAFNEVLQKEGVKSYPSTVSLMKELIKEGIRVGVASSSKNCQTVLEAAGLINLIETRVDGVVSAELQLRGKPEPDIFITACHNLGAKPSRAVVVEDALSGVAAGRKGNFGLVIGIAREENARELLINGADLVCNDLEEIGIEDIDHWFDAGLEKDGWKISYHSYEPSKEKTREALLAIGNGYLGSRGAMEECTAGDCNYPGTYIAGLYNRLITRVSGKDIENEDFVNIPNCFPMTFRIDEGEWFDVNGTEILSFFRELDFRNGLLSRSIIARDPAGRETRIVSKRFASMANPHLLCQQYSVEPLNYQGHISFLASLDGDIINAGVERYKSLNQQHLQPVEQRAEGNSQYLLVSTTQSGVQIAVAADYHFYINDNEQDTQISQALSKAKISGTVNFDAAPGNTYCLEKRIAVYTNKQDDVDDPRKSAQEALVRMSTFERLLGESQNSWSSIWEKVNIRIDGDRYSQKLIRLHTYHMMVSMSPNNKGIDASIGARGLHGEAYRGHIFWDELFVFPFYDLMMPDVARAMLLYRYRRLDKARENAAAGGYEGAMFPWQSGSDGSEQTQIVHLNPLSGQWDPDHSCLQRHVSLAIAYNIWQYFHITDDREFMIRYGLELYLDICRFWASKCDWDAFAGRYNISGVMGPDEFHESYPGDSEGGLTNNAYTNLMLAWIFDKAGEILGILNISLPEAGKWKEMAEKLNLCIDENGIIAQYEGYFDLKELDWGYYREKYGNVYRMDRILKSEGKSPDEYKVAKQADTLMTFYNLEKEEVDKLCSAMGYSLPDDYLQKNLQYYLQRTSHGSTLSRLVHSKLGLLAGDARLSWELYSESLASDYIDIQGGTTAEGIHAGVMGGTLVLVINSFAGIKFGKENLCIEPCLPDAWEALSFGVQFRGVHYKFVISRQALKIQADRDCTVVVKSRPRQVKRNETIIITDL